jgi:hypothetical protein
MAAAAVNPFSLQSAVSMEILDFFVHRESCLPTAILSELKKSQQKPLEAFIVIIIKSD